MTGEIRYVKRHEVNDDKWNACVRDAVNGLCYSDTSFLDIIAVQWTALVLNDYEAVMPLIWRRKFGVHYLYQPFFCQQTGISSISSLQYSTDDFLDSIPKKFRYWDIQLNASNKPDKTRHTLRKNYLLSLASPYEELHEKYHRNAVRNIRKAQDQQIIVRENIPASLLIQLHLDRFASKSGIPLQDYKALEELLNAWVSISRATIIGAADDQGNIIASSGYLIYKNRITFLINGNSASSLHNGASHLLKDHIIRKYAGSDYVLDFEGSDNPEFARFYEQFGASSIEHYPRIKLNKLQWPLNWLKR
jgi:hypothetical protein